MVALVMFVFLLIGWSFATRRHIRRRADADDQRRYVASEVRTGGHVWLLGAILSTLFAAGFVAHSVRVGLGGTDSVVLLLLAAVAWAAAIRCWPQAILASQRARAISRSDRDD